MFIVQSLRTMPTAQELVRNPVSAHPELLTLNLQFKEITKWSVCLLHREKCAMTAPKLYAFFFFLRRKVHAKMQS